MRGSSTFQIFLGYAIQFYDETFEEIKKTWSQQANNAVHIGSNEWTTLINLNLRNKTSDMLSKSFIHIAYVLFLPELYLINGFDWLMDVARYKLLHTLDDVHRYIDDN